MASEVGLGDLAAAVRIFVQRNSRWPSELATEPQEVHLALWLAHVREQHRDGLLPAVDLARLSHLIPGWKFNSEQQWLCIARMLSNEVLLAGFESVIASSPFLNGWMNGQATLCRLDALDPRKRRWLDAHVPGWLHASVGKPAWAAEA